MITYDKLTKSQQSTYNVHALEFSHLQNTDYICAYLFFMAWT